MNMYLLNNFTTGTILLLHFFELFKYLLMNNKHVSIFLYNNYEL